MNSYINELLKLLSAETKTDGIKTCSEYAERGVEDEKQISRFNKSRPDGKHR